MTTRIPARELRPGMVYRHRGTKATTLSATVIYVDVDMRSSRLVVRCWVTPPKGKVYEWTFVFEPDEQVEIEERDNA